MAVWVPWARVLVAGDYLSPVEIPMLSPGGSASAYLATLARLEPLVEQAEYVVPGHGAPVDGTRAAAILREDRAYVEALLDRGAEAKLPLARRTRRPEEDPRGERGAGRRVSMHQLSPDLRALGEAILEVALERLAADPPDLGHALPPAEVAALAGVTVTPEGLGPEEALARFRDVLLPLTTAIDHPRYLAFIPSAPTPASALIDLLVSATSVYAGSWLEGAGAVHAENEALRWLADLAGLPPEAGGCFVQGGTNGNISALHAARERARHRGEAATHVACSEEVHSSVRSSARIMDVDMPWWIGVLVCLATGAAIGLVIGILVARVGIPSFVVTLAGFLGLQGLLLQIIGEGGTIRIQSETVLAIMSKNLPIWLGWLLFVVLIVGYAGVTFRQMTNRRSRGLVAQSPTVWALKIAGLAVLLGWCTYYLSTERSRNAQFNSIKGIPIVIPVVLVLLILFSMLLSKTLFGRHVYAVGGNAEAARRAGINVPRIRLLCFVLCSTIAAIAGILLASRVNSVTPSTGGGETLLYAVGAAVIGGTSLFGGKGRPVDAIIGGLVVAVVANGMGLLDKSAAVVYMVTGGVLLLAAGVDALSRRRAAASGRV